MFHTTISPLSPPTYKNLCVADIQFAEKSRSSYVS